LKDYTESLRLLKEVEKKVRINVNLIVGQNQHQKIPGNEKRLALQSIEDPKEISSKEQINNL
jgi:hypothetical protein